MTKVDTGTIPGLSRRSWLSCALAALPSLPLAAESFPTRPVRVLCAYPAGGGVDTAARIVGTELARRFAQPVVVENRGGVAGSLGTRLVAKGTADGYTLLITSNPSITMLPQVSQVGYDPLVDLIALAKVGVSPNLLAVNAASPYRNVQDLFRDADPDKLSLAVPGLGAPPHLELALVSHETEAKPTWVPYAGSAQVATALLGNQVTAGSVGLPPLVPHIKNGKLRALAIFSRKRSPFLPDVPTVSEAIGKEVDVFPNWYGFFAPSATPRDVLAKLEFELLAAAASAGVLRNFRDASTEPLQLGSAAFQHEIYAEIKAVRRASSLTKIQIT